MESVRRPLAAVTAIAATILLAALLVGCGAATPAATTGPPLTSTAPDLPLLVGVTDVAAMRDDGAFVLDVREPDEWAAGHIAGATLIPLGQLPDRLGELPHDRTIVVVCRSGNRSAQGRDILLQAGFAATSMTGGMNDWISAGLAVVTGP